MVEQGKTQQYGNKKCQPGGQTGYPTYSFLPHPLSKDDIYQQTDQRNKDD
jgi:hypothetical protein